MDESIFLCARVAGEVVATQEESGAVTGINRLQVALARQDLDAQWQCRVHSPALPSSLVANLRIDVHGKPVFLFCLFRIWPCKMVTSLVTTLIHYQNTGKFGQGENEIRF